jgi:DNA-binding cell septation regulator SpoVG
MAGINFKIMEEKIMIYTENKNFTPTDTIVSSGKVTGLTGEITIKNVQKVEITKDGATSVIYTLPGNNVKAEDGTWKNYPYAMPITKEARELVNAKAAAATVRAVSSEKRPNLKGYLDIAVPAENFSVMVSIIKNKDGNLFVSTPSRKGQDKDGNTRYYNDVILSDEQKKAVLEAYEASKMAATTASTVEADPDDPMA